MTSGDAVILMDGDLQDTPESLPDMVTKWENGYDVVYAIREKRKEFILKRFAFKLFYKIQNRLVDIPIPLDAGLFSVLDRKVVDILLSLREHNRYLPGLRAFAGFKQIGIQVERAKRYSGDPRVSTRRLIKLAFDGIFSMSHLPLRLATYVGVIIAIPSFILAAVVISMKLFTDHATPGWASNLSSTFFMGGVQLIFLGIIGEYLSRIYDEVKRRPYFIISDTIGFKDQDSNGSTNSHEPV
jgi:dolichol-phosphate mannosyltransferase